MKPLRWAVLALGGGTFAFMLARIDRVSVWRHLSMVGWGMLFIVAQEIVAHVLNAGGWRLAYTPGSPRPSLRELVKLRIMGDGVNYLTPGATVVGEFARLEAAGLGVPREVTFRSIVVAKLGQSTAQALVILFGLLAILATGDGLLPGWMHALRNAAVLLSLALLALCALGSWTRRHLSRDRPKRVSLKDVPRHALGFLEAHPWRFSAAVALFGAGYLWTSVETYFTCLFLGSPVAAATAVVIEVLSNLIDGMTFLVPAKLGAQEAGKTAILAALGLGASSGFAFGVVRHVRELIWAGLGFCWYALDRPAAGKRGVL